MFHLRSIPLTILLAAAIHAQGTVQISIGIRETGAGGGTFTSIGGNGGSLGGIEWVAKDLQNLVLDGTWQQFTFNITTDPLTLFAGTTANGLLDGTFGTLEHVRILNNTGIATPITLWIDDVVNTTTTTGPVTVGDFQGFLPGAEVMFQEPGYSGSTSTNVLQGATSGVSNRVASRSSSCRVDFQFVDGSTTRWVRLTTFNATNQPNPLIRFDNQSVLTFWMRGGVAQDDLGSQGPGTAIAEAVGSGLSASLGQFSIYYTAGAPPSALGLLGISVFGQPDLPIFGGNIVSGIGLLGTVIVFADVNGRTQLPLIPFGVAADFVLQSAFLDQTLPQGFTFTNAVRTRFTP